MRQAGPFGIGGKSWQAVRRLVSDRLPTALEGYRALRGHARALRAEVDAFVAPRYRARCGTYVGVTGSCGKSTTTYLIGVLLEAQGTTRTYLEFNARPTILRALVRLKEPIDYLVQEISGDRPGAIARVARVVQPDVAVVTAVGNDHYANYKHVVSKGEGEQPVSDRFLAAIAQEKGTLVASLKASGVACLNADDPRVRAMAERAPGRVVLYGVSPDATLRAENVRAQWPARMSFYLVIGSSRRLVQTRFVGTLMLSAVLAALAVVYAVDGDLDRAVEDLASIEPLNKRMDVRPGADGHTYILDTVKAPLWQVELLVNDLPSLSSANVVFVLGEISDARNDKSTNYRKLVRRASEAAGQVIGFGPAASSAGKVRAEGRLNVIGIETYDAAVAYLSTLPPSLVILKSNKSAKLSRVWEAVDPSAAEVRRLELERQ
jgi:UDP-N-acetylmuramoyl-tripeptide--D-alanyl-D-alanine ligase